MKLSDWAKKQGISYQTAWRMFKRGLIDGAYQLPTGTIIVPEQEKNRKPTGRKAAALYARVSNHDAKENLERQLSRLREFAEKNGFIVVKEVKEVASGMNEKQKKLLKLLQEDDYDVLIVLYKDRLSRFGISYIDLLLKLKGQELIVVNSVVESEKELIQDMVSIIYSFAARLYGMRRGKVIAKKLKDELDAENKD